MIKVIIYNSQTKKNTMSFGPNPSAQDDYKTDIKLDNSCPPLT